MAIGASGGVPMPGSNGFPMDAFFHVLRSLVMAVSTGFGEPREMEGGFGRSGRNNCVAVMAVGASGGVFASTGQGQAVHAGPVALGLSGVASRTLHLFDRDVVIRMLRGDIGMTTGASIGLVDGGFEFSLIHEDGDALPRRIGHEECLVIVTLHARAIFYLLGRKTSQGSDS